MTTTTGFEIARWLMANLPSPADSAQPLRLTDTQVEDIATMYESDTQGRRIHRRVALHAAKGAGKSPLAAFLAIAELAGPLAPADPQVAIAALSEQQADSTVFSVIFELLRANDGQAAQALGLDEGRGRIYRHGRPGKIESITSVAGSNEGRRTTFVVCDETNSWTRSNGGWPFARTLRRNVGKTGGWSLELANSPEIGLESVAEAALTDGSLLIARRPSIAPTLEASDAVLRALLAEVYVGSPWVDLDRILAEVRDPATPWPESLRYFFNSPAAAAELSLVDPARWDDLAEPREIPDGARIALGFDGSDVSDGTALVAVTEDGYLSLELLIEREKGDPPGLERPALRGSRRRQRPVRAVRGGEDAGRPVSVAQRARDLARRLRDPGPGLPDELRTAFRARDRALPDRPGRGPAEPRRRPRLSSAPAERPAGPQSGRPRRPGGLHPGQTRPGAAD